ncbi:rRNA pseudouridine synthase [Kingella oralis]|uniref:pseudouridine synthase n=1 Tax=Kingella oralis TaxID=505 RepID=UPI002D7F2EDB|nr:rRNA pseudouridine synthase [Kingella oralis]
MTDPIRLSKRMAELGICSRREADSYIEKGWVSVNGKIAVLGQKVSPADRIDLNKHAHEQKANRVTILLNKPVGFVSGQPENDYRAAAELITAENQWEGDTSRIAFHPGHTRNLAPAGRLDIDSVGLLVLTQDGRIAKQLIGDNGNSEKEYLVRVKGSLKENGLALLNHGLSLDGEKLRPAQVSWQNQDQLRFVLKQGKKRQIRRMCELVGLRVVGLKRIRVGRIKLGALPQGKWRYLQANERF